MDVKNKSEYDDVWLPRKFDCPILISLHKSGSTWVFSHIHKHYRKMGMTMPPNNLYSEFFHKYNSPDLDFHHQMEPTENQFVQRSVDERFALLEMLRTFGLELAHKAHVPEIIDIWPRFKEFYKGYNIIVLKRRYIWPHYLNLLFMYCVKQAVGEAKLKGKEKEGFIHLIPTKVSTKHNYNQEDILKSTIQEYGVQFKHHDIVLNSFTRSIRFLNDVVLQELDKPEVIYTEDIDKYWLRKRFNVELKKTVEPFKTLDFATYFKPEDMAIIKEKFKERFDNEFQFFGYEYK